MDSTEKFSSVMSKKLLRELRTHAAESKKAISTLLDEAVSEYLNRVRVRSIFMSSADSVLDRHSELLKRLAK